MCPHQGCNLDNRQPLVCEECRDDFVRSAHTEGSGQEIWRWQLIAVFPSNDLHEMVRQTLTIDIHSLVTYCAHLRPPRTLRDPHSAGELDKVGSAYTFVLIRVEDPTKKGRVFLHRVLGRSQHLLVIQEQ